MLFIFLQFYFHMCCIWTYCLWPFWLLFDLINGLSLLALYSYSWRVSCFLLFLVSERFPCPIFHLHHNRGRRIIPFSTAHRIFTKARWLGFSANIFLTNLGSFFLINSNSHESALTCSILCRLRDILKHTLSNLFPFSQQQRFALPHFHGHCKPPFHSWPLLSTLQLVACFQTALTTVTACGLSEKERVRFGEEFLRGVGGWYLGHPPLTLSPKLLAANCPEAFCFRLLRLRAEAAMQFNDKQLSHCPQLPFECRGCAQYWAASKTHTETRAGCWEGFAAQERCSCCRLYYSGQRQYMGQNWEYSFDSFLWNMKPLLRINVHFQLCLNCCLISLSF